MQYPWAMFDRPKKRKNLHYSLAEDAVCSADIEDQETGEERILILICSFDNIHFLGYDCSVDRLVAVEMPGPLHPKDLE